ncbi:MAG TPA: AAA family ATPase [Candidatus Binatia bacterium]|nr:AAA family ATPase [Candidatus Binatia bacterium]
MSEAAVDRILLLSEILGQDHVVAMLRHGLERKTLHHALLFVGPEGVGKRSAAVGLAARLLCERRGAEACGACAACIQVRAGSHPDLRREGFFYDVKRKEARDHTLIDQVRGVQLFLGGQALGGGSKIVIFEEAQALTEDAQNALLKTLEEPPRGSVLVLVCHNASRLLPTVLSRCQRVAFAPLERATVETILRDRLHVSADDALFLSVYSEGSVVLAADVKRLREAHVRAADLLAACAGGYADVVRAVREASLSTPRGLPLELKMVLLLLRRHLRAQAGVEDAAELTPASKTATLVGALHAAEAAYAAVVDFGRNANRALAAERMALRIGDSLR